ncbi:D-ribose pyranase [Loktanella atrilutea]|uniref:D-ribose pyranase n=1 Tax=Loktanella atrilutea TaxID=366533 RepID=A0A1M5AZA9_LOKAT|nr:D-ribose pyranase [Loktanella atrilutea]SHF35578.1 D-ribose pyranase [Loktanella atrilutea]
MKKAGILHAELSRCVASLGHGDLLVIGDAGLPVPPGVPCIDLAVTHGVPTFAQVISAVLSEMQVETCVMATQAGPALLALAPLPPRRVDHADFKIACRSARAVVRTGEVTPFANIGLYAGVTF